MVEVLTPRTLGGLRIAKVAERTPHVNLLVYGNSGVGKTRLLGTSDDCEPMRKVVFLDLEGGAFSLRATNPDVDVVRIPNWASLVEVLQELRAGNHGYNTVVIDSLTEVQKYNLYYVLGLRVEEAEAKEKIADPDIADMRAWQRNSEHMRKVVRAFRDLPMNALFTALVREDKNPQSGAVKLLPSLSGKLASEVAAFLDVVVYMYKKEVDVPDGEVTVKVNKRLLLTSATENVVAKDRSDNLPVVIENPSMPNLYSLITGTRQTTTKSEMLNPEELVNV